MRFRGGCVVINIVVGIVDNVRGAESMERSSVRLSVPSQRREAGLLLSAPRAGVIDRQQEPGHLAAGRRSTALSSKCGQYHGDRRVVVGRVCCCVK